MTKDEKSLLLFLETQLVDHAGKVGTPHMNEDDFVIVKRWHEEGLIVFKRLPAREVFGGGSPAERTHRIRFSEEAWTLALAERKARAERNSDATLSPTKGGSQK